MPCHAILPCISPTVRADAKSRRLGAFVSAVLVAHSAQAVSYCNLTPGHRIPSLHSLASSLRVLPRMQHSMRWLIWWCEPLRQPQSVSPQNVHLRFVVYSSSRYAHVYLWLSSETATPSQPSQPAEPVRASEPANAARRFTASRLTTAPL